MSNYAHNQILCIGPEDEIDKIRTMVVKAIKLAECIMADKKDSINRAEHHLFQQLIPIPDDYDFCNLSFLVDNPTVEELEKKKISIASSSEEVTGYLKILESAIYCRKKHGYSCEYAFRCGKWGTKNYYDIQLEYSSKNTLVFNLLTAWNAPVEYLSLLSSLFPGIRIYDFWNEEFESEEYCVAFERGKEINVVDAAF